MTASLMPSARRQVRLCSRSPDVLNGARAYGRSIQRRNGFHVSKRCSLLRLEKAASLVSMAYTSPFNVSAYKART